MKKIKFIDPNKPILYRGGLPLINDIKYRGPFSYREMRIIAFLMMIISQLATMILTANKSLHVLPDSIERFRDLVDLIGLFSLPLFLMASFAIILSDEKKIIKTLIFYFSMAFAIYLGMTILFGRYLKGTLAALTGMTGEDLNEVADALGKAIFGSLTNVNVFIDMFILTLFSFFVLYTPKIIKRKGALLAFRLCSLFPVLIAFGSAVLFGLINLQKINPSFLVLAALPCRAISVYLIFFAIVLFVKYRKNRFMKKGGTEEEYDIFCVSNVSSLQYSLFISGLLIAVFLIDLVILEVLPSSYLFGFGNSFYMFIIIPLVLLFSYNKKRSNPVIDILLPFIYIGALGASLIELSYQLILTL